VNINDMSGTGTVVSNQPEFTVPTGVAGTYIYEATHVSCGTPVYATVIVTVQAKPEFTITVPDEACINSILTLMSEPMADYWTLLDGTLVFNPIFKTITNTYVGHFSDGVCSVTDTIVIEVIGSPSDFSVRPDTTVLIGDVMVLWSEGGDAHWTHRETGVYLGQGTQTISHSAEGVNTYVAELYHVCGVISKSVEVIVKEFIIAIDRSHITFESDIECEEGTGWAALSISNEPTHGPFTIRWTWHPDSTSHRISGMDAGSHGVQIIDRSGASVYIPFTIVQPAALDLRILSTTQPGNVNCNDGQIYTFTDGGRPFTGGRQSYDYWWNDDPDGIYNERDRRDLEEGIYTLTVYDSKGCSATAVIPLPCLAKPIVTNYISPNDDGFNDVMKIKYIERYPNNKVTIFNSYGEEVRVFRNYNNVDVVWNGTNKRGQVLPDGTYYYVLEADGTAITTGWVLIRGSKSK
jgi:gliding motility-associated-like protein